MRVLILIKKEMAVELRSLETLLSALFFALLLTIISSICFGSLPALSSKLLPGVFWLIYVFSATLVVSRSLHAEKELGLLPNYLLAGVSPEELLIAKWLFNWAVVTLLGVAIFLFISIFYSFNGASIAFSMGALVALTSVGFAALGTLCSAMLNKGRLQLLFPLIFYPLVLPLVIPAIYATQNLIAGEPAGSLMALGGISLIFLAASYMLIGKLIEE